MYAREAEELLERCAKAAIDGTLTDSERVSMYRLALTIAADELYRIEETSPGTVNVGALILIQHLGMLCDPTVDHAKVAQQIAAFATREAPSEDSRGS